MHAGAIGGRGTFVVFDRPSYLSEISCNGSELSIFQCSHALTNRFSCPTEDVAGVICQGTSNTIIFHNTTN